jgi:Na+-exporting ATPase
MLSSFAIVQFGFYDGSIGQDCNIEYSASCESVFRARTACFTVTMWSFSIFAWQLVDLRRSLFDGLFESPKAWALRLWSNPFLFWSVITGVVSPIPVTYIPVINKVGFLHGPIEKEWGIIFAMLAVFIAATEAWKWAKRVYFRKHNAMFAKDAELGEETLEKRAFERFYNSESFSSKE